MAAAVERSERERTGADHDGPVRAEGREPDADALHAVPEYNGRTRVARGSQLPRVRIMLETKADIFIALPERRSRT